MEHIKNILIPSEGMFITQNYDVNIQDRVISDRVYLGVNDSEDNWKEIDEIEAEAIRQLKEEIQEELEPQELN